MNLNFHLSFYNWFSIVEKLLIGKLEKIWISQWNFLFLVVFCLLYCLCLHMQKKNISHLLVIVCLVRWWTKLSRLDIFFVHFQELSCIVYLNRKFLSHLFYLRYSLLLLLLLLLLYSILKTSFLFFFCLSFVEKNSADQ